MDVIGVAADPPRRRPGWLRVPGGRRRWAVVAVAALGLTGYVLTHRYQPAPVGPAAPVDAGQLAGRNGLGPAGLQVLLTGDELRTLDLHTGLLRPVTGLPAGVSTDGASALPVRGGMIVHTSGQGSVDSYLLRPGRPPRLIIRNGVALPAWDGNGVIVSALPIGTEQYSVTGQTLDGRRQWQWVAPNHMLVVQDTRYGLVIQDTEPPLDPQRLRLVRRDTGRPVREIAGTPVAVGGDAIARLRPGCGRACTLALTRIPTGAIVAYRLPAEPATGHGSFAPGNRWLAMPLPPGPAPGALPDQPSRLAVLDLATGTTTTVPGLAFPPGQPPLLTWSADGQWLVVGVRTADAIRLGIWRPDTPAAPLTVLPGDYPADSSTTLTAVP